MRVGLVATALVATQFDYAQADVADIGLKILEATRGTWLGFNRGLYKRANSSPMDLNCMDNETAENLNASVH